MVVKVSNSSWNEDIDPGGRQWNHTRADLSRLDGNTLQSGRSFSHWSVMTCLKCIKWLNGSPEPSNIWNFGMAKP